MRASGNFWKPPRATEYFPQGLPEASARLVSCFTQCFPSWRCPPWQLGDTILASWRVLAWILAKLLGWFQASWHPVGCQFSILSGLHSSSRLEFESGVAFGSEQLRRKPQVAKHQGCYGLLLQCYGIFWIGVVVDAVRCTCGSTCEHYSWMVSTIPGFCGFLRLHRKDPET